MTIAPSLLNAPAALALSHVTRARSWLHIQDFEVDAAFDLGLLKSKGAGRIALAVERWLMRRFDVVSSISGQDDRARGRQGRRGSSVRVHSAELGRYDGDLSARSTERVSSRVDIRRAYDGRALFRQHGREAGLEVLAETAAALAHREDIVFVFCGNGATKAQLQSRCATLPNCRFMSLAAGRAAE